MSTPILKGQFRALWRKEPSVMVELYNDRIQLRLVSPSVALDQISLNDVYGCHRMKGNDKVKSSWVNDGSFDSFHDFQVGRRLTIPPTSHSTSMQSVYSKENSSVDCGKSLLSRYLRPQRLVDAQFRLMPMTLRLKGPAAHLKLSLAFTNRMWLSVTCGSTKFYA